MIVSTGADPRVAKGAGGAVINFAVHCLMSCAEPVANLCASGVLDRHARLRFAAVESGIGWIHWFLDGMDEGYLKHHMWAFPKLRHGLPSDYFRPTAISSLTAGSSSRNSCSATAPTASK